jgi:sugar lactone lactonase YvrE
MTPRPFRNFSVAIVASAIIAGVSARILNSQSTSVSGYGVLSAQTGQSAPAGSALFSYAVDGVLVSQAGVEATVPVQTGTIFVDETGTRTALALANPAAAASAVLILRDGSGNEVARRTQSIGIRQHTARYVRELFENLPGSFTGSLTFESNVPLAALTLRENRNGRGEPLYATLPVIDPSAPRPDPLMFPHIAVGNGYTTQILLINSGGDPLKGVVRLVASGGGPLLARLSGRSISEFPYSLNPHGTLKAELEGVSGLSTGYAAVVPNVGSVAPMGAAVFQYRTSDVVITEAGVLAAPVTSEARLFVDNAGTRTGVAVANPNAYPATVTLALMDGSGNPLFETIRDLPSGSHFAAFANELFPGMVEGFNGLMEVRGSAPLSAVALKLTVNSRNDLVLTTLPVADMTKPSTAASLLFPQVAIGGGFSTRFILLNSDRINSSNGTLSFVTPDGNDRNVFFEGFAGSRFSYQIGAGGVRQWLAGNASFGVSAILVIDPETNQPTSEITINEGGRVRPNVRVIDSTGTVRTDIEVSYNSVSPEVAAPDNLGSLIGKEAGFSTLTLTAGGTVATVTATVVRVTSGAAGFNIGGVSEDLAQRLYLAATQGHTVLQASTFNSQPEVYAGVTGSAGLKDDVRRQSLFRNPVFLAINHANGSIYVSDAANHAIRRIFPGVNGRVETVAGGAGPGDHDGRLNDATFNNPQGVALDAKGYLWVADSGNHTIRRIDLTAGTVQTVAGVAGSPGSSDGTGSSARFFSPQGIAIEPESRAQELERERRGGALPEVRLIVADSGNGLIRRVHESGVVETISAGNAITHTIMRANPLEGGSSRSLTRFAAPVGVAVDSSGTIYVTEPDTGSLRALLPGGDIVSVVQSQTLRNPLGVAASSGGHLIVTDGKNPVREIRFGEPRIDSIDPSTISMRGGERVTVRGANFGPDSVIVVGNRIVARETASGALPNDTQRFSFVAPPLSSGVTTVSVQNRGGTAQRPLLVEPTPLRDLAPGTVTTFAGGSSYVGDGFQALNAVVAFPRNVQVDASGNHYIVDYDNNRIRKIDAATGIITTIAGTGENQTAGDGDLAVAASLSYPRHIRFDSAGNIYVDGAGGVRKIDAATRKISTVVGGGTTVAVDGDLAARISIWASSVTLDSSGNIYVGEDRSAGNRILKADVRTGRVTTFAGGQTQYGGDGGRATPAGIETPIDMAFGPDGSMYFVERVHNRIRKIEFGGIISTFAGTGQAGFSGDNGPATVAQLRDPQGVAVDADGNVLIADCLNHRIRKVDVATGIITTVAGIGQGWYSGDGESATNAGLNSPTTISVDGAGNLLIGDTNNLRIRRVNARSRTITTIAGNGEEKFFGDGQPAYAAAFGLSFYVAFDRSGNLFVYDRNRIRRIDGSTESSRLCPAHSALTSMT